MNQVEQPTSVKEILNLLKTQDIPQDLYQKQLQDLKEIAIHFRVVQNTYAQAFNLLHTLQQNWQMAQQDADQT